MGWETRGLHIDGALNFQQKAAEMSEIVLAGMSGAQKIQVLGQQG